MLSTQLVIGVSLLVASSAPVSSNQMNAQAEMAEEVGKFAVSNGFDRLNLVRVQDLSSPLEGKGIHLIKALQKNGNIQLATTNIREVQVSSDQIIKENFLFSQLNSYNDWLVLLPLLSHIRVQSTIVISSWEFSELSSHGLNVHAYVLQRSSMTWFEITGLNNTSDVLIRKVSVCDTCMMPRSVRTNLDFQNITITSVECPWEPYNSMESCKGEVVSCKPGGIGGKVVQLASSIMNLTFRFSVEPQGEWGTLPVQGDKRFKNATWQGVMGQVIKGQSHLSISMWQTHADRLDISDFALVYSTILDTVLSPRTPEADMGFFVRPFTLESWKAIAITLVINLLLITLSLHYSGGNTNSWSFRMAHASGMLLWILTNAFYSGALTMFFSKEKGHSFTSVEEVIEAYPEWKLVIVSGVEYRYDALRTKSEAFEKFWQRILTKPQETIVATEMEGMNQVVSEKTVIQIRRDFLGYLFNKNISALNKYSIAFSSLDRIHSSFLLTDNSPLTPAFEYCFIFMRELGLTQRILQMWFDTASLNKEMTTASTMAVTPGQLILIFIVMIVGILAALLAFLGEIYMYKWQLRLKSREKRNLKSRQPL